MSIRRRTFSLKNTVFDRKADSEAETTDIELLRGNTREEPFVIFSLCMVSFFADCGEKYGTPELSIIEYIEMFYNSECVHQALEYQTPNEFAVEYILAASAI